MKKRLFIIGARGFGRKVYWLAKESIGYDDTFVVEGFLDDKKSALDGYEGYPKIVSSVEDFEPGPEDVFICALGDVTYKKQYCDIILSRGGKFISLISKSAIIEQNVNFGDGCIIFGGVRICCDTSIGSFNTFQSYVVIGHDVIIGSGCHFNTFSFLGGFVKISDLVTVQTGAIIHPHKILNKRCVIGAGAVVLRNVPAQTTVYGNPAIKLKI